MDELFGIATGCLGWPPSEAWAAAVPEILLAWEAKVEFIRNTSPFGTSGSAGVPGQPDIPDGESAEDRRARIKAQMQKRKARDHL